MDIARLDNSITSLRWSLLAFTNTRCPWRKIAMLLCLCRFLSLAAGCAAVPATACLLHAQPYPIQPIAIVVPYAAGGPGDTVARVLVDRLKGALGQPIIIENVTGANGSIAVGRVA